MNDRQACVAIRAFMLGLKEIRLRAEEHGFESASGLKFSLRFQYGSGVEVSSEPHASLQHVLSGDAQRSEVLAVLREMVRLCPDMDLADWEAVCREAVSGDAQRSEVLAVLREMVRLCPDMDLADWEAACREAVVGGVMRE